MTALALVIAAAAVVALALIARNIHAHTREVPAIADEGAEQRSHGIAEGIRRMDSLGKEANR